VMQGEDVEEDDECFRDATVTGGFRDAVTKLLDSSPQPDDPSGTCRYDATYQLGQTEKIRTIDPRDGGPLCYVNVRLHKAFKKRSFLERPQTGSFDAATDAVQNPSSC